MFSLILLLVATSLATIAILDPSDFADLSGDAADNTLTAEWDYAPLSYQEYLITGPYIYNDTSKEVSHKTLTVARNDTSVVVVTESSHVNMSGSTVIKNGYSSDLYQSSFYGLNAAVNIANASVAYLDNVNVNSSQWSRQHLCSRSNCRTTRHLTAGLLAGAVIFSYGSRESGSEISLTNSRLTELPDDAAGLWFGNVIASTSLVRSQINTTSGILVIAHYTQVTQEFNHFADSTAAAEATITISESTLTGDLVAFNGSSFSWVLGNYSTWTGKTYSGYGNASFSVSLDATSSWTLTGNTALTNFTDADTTLGNVHCAGYNLYYDSSSAHNRCASKKMHGEGYIKPATKSQLQGSH
ncbi:hypothetical protein PENSUB_3474 [Penicillium subrubescens]|uniref:Uncharacterized protein n=1 Tax=Penicillium subrubescens TaxID=1316194 RepID=A0A1Q5UF54_9EURO|nr:hypothetical protein PENSUB_3474 [Penicillium subrubescens]